MVASKSIFLFLNMSGGEIFVIMIFILLFFGAESIPKVAKSAGKILYQIRNATDDIKRDIQNSSNNIRKDIMDQTKGSNPIKDLKDDIEDSIKDIN